MTNEELAEAELRTMRSAWRALTVRWDLTVGERGELFPDGGEGDARPPRGTEHRMRLLIEIGYRVGLPECLLHDWLRTSSPVLNHLSPLEAMSGPIANLRGFRRLVETGFAS